MPTDSLQQIRLKDLLHEIQHSLRFGRRVWRKTFQQAGELLRDQHLEKDAELLCEIAKRHSWGRKPTPNEAGFVQSLYTTVKESIATDSIATPVVEARSIQPTKSKAQNGKGKTIPKPRKVSQKSEGAIERAIRSLPPGSTQEQVAEAADVSKKTVQRSKAWATRMLIWGTMSAPPEHREIGENGEMGLLDGSVRHIDATVAIDVEGLVRDRMDLLHYKTKQSVSRLMESEQKDYLLEELTKVHNQMPLNEMDRELFQATVSSTAKRVKADKCPV